MALFRNCSSSDSVLKGVLLEFEANPLAGVSGRTLFALFLISEEAGRLLYQGRRVEGRSSRGCLQSDHQLHRTTSG
jgi:hypothetical protein